MPIYFRKSVSAGPFRFNFSKGGVGVSVGVKGLRFGTGPRGHYVHAGRGGFYYRASFSGNGSKSALGRPPTNRPRTPSVYGESSVDMIPVSSVDVLEMQDSRFTDLLQDINAKQNALSMAWVMGGVAAATALLGSAAIGLPSLMAPIFGGVAGAILGLWVDSFQRCSVLFYELEDDAYDAYQRVTAAFDDLVGCAGKWHIDAGGAVRDIHAWKRNAGASHLVDKRPTTFGYSLPRVVKSNVTPPAIKVGKETIYFLPDVALVVENEKIGAVAYDNLDIRWEDSNFIEDGAVPPDTTVLRYTWKHPNKSGGPDRRFANNRQIPVCRYEAIYFTSRSGLNEMLQVSRNGLAKPFAHALRRLVEATGSEGTKLAIPNL